MVAWVALARSSGPDVILGCYSLRHFLLALVISYVGIGGYFVFRGGAWHRQRLFAWLAISAALVLALGALEIPAALRLVDYRIVFNTPFVKAWENPRNRLDPELLHLHAPYSQYQAQVPGDLVNWFGIETHRRYPVDVRYDRHGFRNREDRDTADIVMIGDSFVEGSIVSYEDIGSTRLEKSLQVPVLNLGQIGYGPQQQAAVLRRFGLPARPRVVVWMLFEGNDLTHDFRRYQQTVADWKRSTAREHGLWRRSLTRNSLAVLSRWTTKVEIDRTLAQHRGGRLSVPSAAGDDTMYFAYELHGLTDQDWQNVQAALAVIAESRNRAVEAGARFLLVFAPVKFRVYHDLCRFTPETDPARWTVNDLPERIAVWAQEHDLPFLDLTPALRMGAASGRLVYFPDDGHWNAEGHAVAAEQMAQWLRTANWLDSPAVRGAESETSD